MGLLTGPATPRRCSIARTKAVLPAPRSPARSICKPCATTASTDSSIALASAPPSASVAATSRRCSVMDNGRMTECREAAENTRANLTAALRADSPADLVALPAQIRQWGAELGFAQIGIADVDVDDAAARLNAWIDEGRHGDMDYLQRMRCFAPIRRGCCLVHSG